MNAINFRFTAIIFLLGAIMVTTGEWIRPVPLEHSFEISKFLEINNIMTVWIRSFQALIFGLFILIIGLVALGTLFQDSLAKILINPGIVVCVLALFLSAISQGYYMHIGAWGGWHMSEINISDRETFFRTLITSHEWVICLARMGKMFFCLGFTVLGVGLVKGNFLDKLPGATATLIGLGGMAILMVYPDSTLVYKPIDVAIVVWIIVTGVFMLIRSYKVS